MNVKEGKMNKEEIMKDIESYSYNDKNYNKVVRIEDVLNIVNEYINQSTITNEQVKEDVNTLGKLLHTTNLEFETKPESMETEMFEVTLSEYEKYINNITSYIAQLEKDNQELKIDNYQNTNLIKKYHNNDFPQLREEIVKLEGTSITDKARNALAFYTNENGVGMVRMPFHKYNSMEEKLSKIEENILDVVRQDGYEFEHMGDVDRFLNEQLQIIRGDKDE